MVIGRSTSAAISRMNTVAALYPPTADLQQSMVPDFHSVRQALNVASADQRILVLVGGDADAVKPLKESLRGVVNAPDIIGRFHFDFEESDDWKQTVEGASKDAGIFVIRPGEFGLDGQVMHHLPLTTGNKEIMATLLNSNATFAKTTKKKVYSDHVSKGRSLGVYFEGAVPYGEDRDGDGQIDGRGGSRSRSRSR